MTHQSNDIIEIYLHKVIINLKTVSIVTATYVYKQSTVRIPSAAINLFFNLILKRVFCQYLQKKLFIWSQSELSNKINNNKKIETSIFRS